jgi:hypothetical protein
MILPLIEMTRGGELDNEPMIISLVLLKLIFILAGVPVYSGMAVTSSKCRCPTI